MLHIKEQRYPCYDGSTPLTWAVYLDDEFLCYSWSLSGAMIAMSVIYQLLEN